MTVRELIIHAVGILIFAILTIQAPGQEDSSHSAPVIHFSLYAPEQKDIPVQIIGFEHDKSELRFVLSNASAKPVVAVLMVKTDIVPRGCATEPERGPETFWLVKDVHPAAFLVSIKPHANGIAAQGGIYVVGSPPPGPIYLHWPKNMIKNARSDRAGYMQFQFGITAVLFDDGTTWPAGIEFYLRRDFDASKVRSPGSPEEDAKLHAVLHPQLFDSPLAEAEAGKCADVATVVNALKAVKETVFDREIPQFADSGDAKALPPHFRFSCSLEGSKAICRMPLQTDPTSRMMQQKTH